MTTRIAHRLARVATLAACSRCLTQWPLRSGDWHAAEHGDPGVAVCDRCAERDDSGGYAHLLAWRRMSGTTGRSAA